MRDLIDRQAAIEAICEHGTDLERRGIMVLAVSNHKQATVDLLESLPSAQQWIPVSERLPEECKQVLVCDDYQFIYVAEYEVFSDGVGRWSESTELLIIENVTAWMPLPEPWRGQ